MRISDWSSDVCSSDLCLSQRLVRVELAPTLAERIRTRRTQRTQRVQPRDARLLRPPTGLLMQRLRVVAKLAHVAQHQRSEEHTSELQSLMRISYAVFCLKKKTK